MRVKCKIEGKNRSTIKCSLDESHAGEGSRKLVKASQDTSSTKVDNVDNMKE